MTVLDANVEVFLQDYADARDENGRRLVVRNGHLPPHRIMTGVGSLEVKRLRVRDRPGENDQQTVRFTSKALPPYLRESQSVTDSSPGSTKGISTK